MDRLLCVPQTRIANMTANMKPSQHSHPRTPKRGVLLSRMRHDKEQHEGNEDAEEQG
jgi:hypothetical protein